MSHSDISHASAASILSLLSFMQRRRKKILISDCAFSATTLSGAKTRDKQVTKCAHNIQASNMYRVAEPSWTARIEGRRGIGGDAEGISVSKQ